MFLELSEGLVLSISCGLSSRHSGTSAQFSEVPTTIAKKAGSETRGMPGDGAVVEGVLAEAGRRVQPL